MFENLISELFSSLPAVAIAILIAAVSSWITVRLSLNRFRDEKWWEKKVATYEKLIQALHDLKYDTDTSYDAYITHREVPEDKAESLRAASDNARFELEKAVNIGGFLINEQCQIRLRTFLKESKATSNANDYFSHLDEYSAAINNCLKDVLVIAKQDVRKS